MTCGSDPAKCLGIMSTTVRRKPDFDILAGLDAKFGSKTGDAKTISIEDIQIAARAVLAYGIKNEGKNFNSEDDVYTKEEAAYIDRKFGWNMSKFFKISGLTLNIPMGATAIAKKMIAEFDGFPYAPNIKGYKAPDGVIDSGDAEYHAEKNPLGVFFRFSSPNNLKDGK